MQGVARQPDPQCARPGREDHGRVHCQGLAVDTDLHHGAGIDLESRRTPLGPPAEPADRACRLERRQHPGLGRIGDHDSDDTEHAIVQPQTGPAAPHVIELIPVVGHEDQVSRPVSLAVRSGIAQVERGGVRAEQVGHMAAAVLSFASRYSGDWTISA